jgi:multimeric flavodoxin WrbA
MKITLINGNQDSLSFDNYLKELIRILKEGGHQAVQIDLKVYSLKYCTGCFECWTRTPGICDHDKASQELGREVINSDFTLWAAPLKMGFPSALLKTALDKHLPLIHPYLVVDQGEAHHLKRYPTYPRVGLLVEDGLDTDERDLGIIKDVFSRTALNFKTKLDFLETTDLPAKELARKILQPRNGGHFYQRLLGPISGTRINPPSRLTLFNGSPRGKKGNTPIMLTEFAKGFGSEFEIHHLIRVKEIDQHLSAFREAECVWLGFPLYTDAMPGLVKKFIEDLELLVDTGGNPPIGFLVQSGFPEALHSRYIERYLERLAERLGSPYLGTIVKGNGEGVRKMPPEATQTLFDNLNTLGRIFSSTGELDPRILKDIAKPERFPLILDPMFRIFLRTKIAHSYFDGMLIENSAFDQRNDKPFWDGTKSKI